MQDINQYSSKISTSEKRQTNPLSFGQVILLVGCGPIAGLHLVASRPPHLTMRSALIRVKFEGPNLTVYNMAVHFSWIRFLWVAQSEEPRKL